MFLQISFNPVRFVECHRHSIHEKCQHLKKPALDPGVSPKLEWHLWVERP